MNPLKPSTATFVSLLLALVNAPTSIKIKPRMRIPFLRELSYFPLCLSFIGLYLIFLLNKSSFLISIFDNITYSKGLYIRVYEKVY